VKRTIEIDDTLQHRVDSAIEDVKQELLNYLEENPDTGDVPCISNDLDYSGAIHEIVDGWVPIYTREIDGLFYLYGSELEEAFEDAGIGEKEDKGWPCGWKPAAIYCYIENQVHEWYRNNAEEIFEEWKEKRDAALEEARQKGREAGEVDAATMEEYADNKNPYDGESALGGAWRDAYEEAFDAVRDEK
jgi:hypothetical protein